ncbi:MAG: hypothetical protein JSR45_12415 [Proteobacteria bacterium]|nr:hypothetical protein [Pseudomonadota bacterium]
MTLSAVSRAARLAAPLLAVLAAGCATPARKASADIAQPIGEVLSQPAKDLNLVREAQSPTLVTAYANPYGEAGRGCEQIVAEIRALDAAIGQDLDTPGWKASVESQTPGAFAHDAVRDLVGLPFRGVVRRISGADRRDRVSRAMVVSGVARRAYLKGRGQAAGCAPPAAPSPVPVSPKP